MASALLAIENAEVVFAVPAVGDAVTTDAVTGNVTPVMEDVVVALYARAERVEDVAYPGVDVARVVFSAYAVDPQEVDARVVVGSAGVLTFDGVEWDVEVVELRAPYGATGLIGSTLRSVLGDKMRLVAKGQR
jgi:hypothetical protein